MPGKIGGQVEADWHDAKNLAKLFRSGKLTKVWVSDKGQKPLRGLLKAREETVKGLAAQIAYFELLTISENAH